jgi:preprotein translocase subunit SecG
MLTFLLVIHAIITATLVGVILMQRSEGGGLGMGGSPTGLMSARGAADFLTRATTILATLFILLSVVSAVVASRSATSKTIDTSLARTPAPVAPAPSVPLNGDPLAAVANSATPTGAAPAAVPLVVPKPDTPKLEAKIARKPETVSATSRPAPVATKPPVVVTTTAAPATTPAGNGN